MKATVTARFAACAGTTALMLMVGGASAASALRAGDRVLASPLSLRDAKYWRACTITAVHEFVPKRAYALSCDAQGGNAAGSFTVNEDWVKPLVAANAGIAPPSTSPFQSGSALQPMRTQDNTAPAATHDDAQQCPPSDPDSKGGTHQEQLARAAIRQAFERSAAAGADGAVTVTFQGISIGAAHAYREYEDPAAANGKTIFPVTASFTTCTDYHRRMVEVSRERLFACYAVSSAAWACDTSAAANTNVNDTTRSIDKR